MFSLTLQEHFLDIHLTGMGNTWLFQATTYKNLVIKTILPSSVFSENSVWGQGAEDFTATDTAHLGEKTPGMKS